MRGRGPAPRPLSEIHGKRGTYTNRRCHCAKCREAQRVWRRTYYERTGR